ncbi:phospholipase D family protein [Stappia sp. GBMRC 2046]|uniref:Phospholipase D n=1 Tax=Stappia sediminis TaxID=2692190 RepID=A0A7X3S8I9_9HYPH|nr:phospholipase D family protein [Stappia sediminis]MXN65805.1 phospholipase D family protein [Stappia sediminis]
MRKTLLAAVAGICSLTVFLAACATSNFDYPRTETSAFSSYGETYLGRLFRAEERNNPGKSGTTLVIAGRNAFTARVAMSELAERSLDLQYYIWDADQSGRLLAQELLDSADRGVRVRLLVDDISAYGRDDAVAALDAHPNIEIRLFNPFANRGVRAFEFLGDFERLNHRMHNKLMIADNALALLGGRNIGDHYFDVSEEANYRDLDIAAAGPVVRDASAVFDYFWNSEWSIPIAALVDRPFSEEDLKTARQTLAETIDTEGYPHPVNEESAVWRRSIGDIAKRFVWAPTYVVWDDPADFAAREEHGKIIKALAGKLQTVDKELLMENAYFVPRERGTEALAQLSERGVKVRILTNSLSSNDVVAVHAGYSKYRKPLLQAGVELFEVRADSAKVQQTLLSGESKAALHTKATVFDGESVFIGSFNLDPRSANLNTEIGLYVESPKLARQLTAFMNEGVTPGNSYRLELDEDGNIVWTTEIDGQVAQFTNDPNTSFGQRALTGFIGVLPVEGQL